MAPTEPGWSSPTPPGDAYDEALSLRLTRLAREANLQVRALGYKPYIAPGLSSACVSILQTLRGQWHLGGRSHQGGIFRLQKPLWPPGAGAVCGGYSPRAAGPAGGLL